MSNDPMKGANARRPWTRPGDLAPHGKENTVTQTPEEIRERNRIQAARQVPAGDVVALAEYRKKYPWANITAPETVEPYRSPQQIEEDNRVRLMRADQQGRIAHGDSLTEPPSE